MPRLAAGGRWPRRAQQLSFSYCGGRLSATLELSDSRLWHLRERAAAGLAVAGDRAGRNGGRRPAARSDASEAEHLTASGPHG
jgi:hypothetical protein